MRTSRGQRKGVADQVKNDPRHDPSGTAIGLPIRPGWLKKGSMGRQSYGSPISRVWGLVSRTSMSARRRPNNVSRPLESRELHDATNNVSRVVSWSCLLNITESDRTTRTARHLTHAFGSHLCRLTQPGHHARNPHPRHPADRTWKLNLVQAPVLNAQCPRRAVSETRRTPPGVHRS